MSSRKSTIVIGCLVVLCLTQSGCQLLSIPGQLIGGTFGLLGKILGVAQNLPTPPPWMFL